MEGLQAGRIVNYVMDIADFVVRPNTKMPTDIPQFAHIRPAIVVAVAEDGCKVNLQVFPDGLNDGHFGMLWKQGVDYTDNMLPGTWHWPQRLAVSNVPAPPIMVGGATGTFTEDMMRQTHTYVTLGVSQATFDEVKKKLEAAAYGHVFNEDKTEIDMTGIALVVEE